MKPGWIIALTLCLVLLGCGQSAVTPVSPQGSGDSSPSAPSVMATSAPLPTPFPTIDQPAPEDTFAEVGSIAMLSSDDAEGHVVVAGLQTLIIRSFTFDGKDYAADVRLIKAGRPDDPVVVLLDLERRTYDDELLVIELPEGLADSDADAIAIYAIESQTVVASGVFE